MHKGNAREPKTTLAEIASVTGLSVSSVSRALRNSHQISDEQKRIVQEAARALDYRSHLKRPTPSFLTISVCFEDVDLDARGSVYKGIFDSLKDEAKLHNCRILQIGLSELRRQLADADPQFESLVLLGFDREELFDPLAATGLPIVLVNSQDALNRLDSVLPDSFGCGVLIAEHLRKSGCKSTVHIVHQKRVTHLRRLEGYFERRQTQEGTQDQIIDPGSFEEIDLSSITTEIKQQLENIEHSQLDSVVCWGALMQIAFFQVAPKPLTELEVVCVDHSLESQQLPARGVFVCQPAEAMGRQAIQQLVNRQFYPTAPRLRTLLSVQIEDAQKLRE